MKKLLVFLCAVTLVFGMVSMSGAATVLPSSISHTLDLGDTASDTVTVSFDAEHTVFSGVDVMFLCDTTGSMGSAIATMQSFGTAIMSGVSAFEVEPGVLIDAEFGAASYDDVPTSPWGASYDVPYQLDAAIGSQADAQAGINSWTLGYGMDGPESGFIALQELATTDVGWTGGTDKKIVVWMADAPCHDPNDTPGYPGPTQAELIADLTAAGITVIGVGWGTPGSYFDSEGEATAITSATGGSLFWTGTSTAGEIAESITDLIEEELMTVDHLTLVATGDTEGFTTSIVPTSYADIVIDPVDGAERSFDVDFTGMTGVAGTYTFTLDAIADRTLVGDVDVTITVPGAPVPEPATILLLGTGLAGLAAFGRKKFRKK